jgi:hypothetical protein
MSVDVPTKDSEIRAVAELVRELPGYPDFPAATPGYTHMGALLTDAGLQAAIDYASVVQPRVRMLLDAWPEATTTGVFLEHIEKEGLHDVLSWPHGEKPARIEALARLLNSEGVQTVEQLGAWVQDPTSRSKLVALHGIGNKTADYVANLVGHSVSAVDRHIRAFVARAGVDVRRYADVHSLLVAVAEREHVHLGALDRQIWKFMSGGGPGTDSRRTTETGEETDDDLRAELERVRAERDAALQRLSRVQEALNDLLLEL